MTLNMHVRWLGVSFNLTGGFEFELRECSCVL